MSGTATTPLGHFNNIVIQFFEELAVTYPEEKDIKMALEALKFAKKSNVKLVPDLFYENISKPLHDEILSEDEEKVVAYAKSSIQTQFNELSPALSIFDKHWPTMSETNQKAVWKYLKALILMSDKLRRSHA